ncbi:glycosyltransferase [Armatimonas sp.]|uniref:glycosyltransferase n=1 Tax=Armatimonas sp. TaxID=1872638 RepID=UPI00286C6084|nr:glycosyltransferase [Armatimonas sp.]
MPTQSPLPRVLAVNAGGVGNLHGLRARRLTQTLPFDVTVVDIDRSSRKAGFVHMQQLLQDSWDMVYLESTGISAGLPLLRSKHRYIVSSGDPVAGFFKVTAGALQGALFGAYEKQLYRRSAGFIGWTPYLTGRALELGAPRAVTIEGAVELERFRRFSPEERSSVRERLQIPQANLVCGLVGSLTWVARQEYCYGMELVETLKYLKRTDITMLIVGDGDGRARLEARLPANLRDRVVFTGRLPENEVVEAINAMDIGFITQTLDALGSYRLTTKLPEYLACGLPVAMSPIPGYYDYIGEAGWALPPYHPASSTFHQKCAAWLDTLSPEAFPAKSLQARQQAEKHFDYTQVCQRFQRFLTDLLSASS